MGYSAMEGVIGYPQAALFGLPDTVQRFNLGAFMDVQSSYWGGQRLMYGKAVGTIPMGAPCVNTPIVTGGKYEMQMTAVPNTANLGRALYIALTPFTTGQFGWFGVAGNFPIASNASVAADTTVGIAAAGQLGANGAGKQVLGARCAVAATATVAKVGFANSGSLQLAISGSEGWFIGAYLSGTGIAASTLIVDISPDGTVVTLNNATTALVNGTVTATYNNATIFYNVVNINNPIAQGAIT